MSQKRHSGSKLREKQGKNKQKKEKRKEKRENWIQRAIKHPGRVRRYLKRIYGDEAFTKNGEIKQQYVHKAINELKERPPSKRPKGLLNALYAALTLEKLRKD